METSTDAPVVEVSVSPDPNAGDDKMDCEAFGVTQKSESSKEGDGSFLVSLIHFFGKIIGESNNKDNKVEIVLIAITSSKLTHFHRFSELVFGALREMSGKDRIAVFPSRANQVIVKQRTVAALRGTNLLKRKRDAIDMKLRELRSDMQLRKDIADDLLREAIFSVAFANFLNTDFNVIRVANSDHADAYVYRRTQKIVGVTLPSLELVFRNDTPFPLTGLGRGGGQVARVRTLFQEALKNLISYASLDFTVRVLAVASRQNNMRVNALEHVVVPRLQNTHTYIRDELEEFEREDFYRLKRSQAKQLQAKQAFTNMIKKKNAEDEQVENEPEKIFSRHNHVTAVQSFVIDDFDSDEVLRRRTLQRKSSSVWNFSPRAATEDGEEPHDERVEQKPVEATVVPFGKLGDLGKVEKSNQTEFEDEAATQTDLSKYQMK